MEEMARLVEQREQARVRVDAIEAEQREATAAVQRGSEELVALERTDGPAAQRRKVEAELAAARAKAAEPWDERAAGARARVRDRQVEVQAFVAAHLDERSEERRVGKECRARGLRYGYEKA